MRWGWDISRRKLYLLALDLVMAAVALCLFRDLFHVPRVSPVFSGVFLLAWPSVLALLGGYHLANLDRESIGVAILLQSTLVSSVGLLVVRGPLQAGFTSTQLLVICMAVSALLFCHRVLYSLFLGRSPQVEHVFFLGSCRGELLAEFKERFRKTGAAVEFLGAGAVDHEDPRAFMETVRKRGIDVVAICPETHPDKREIDLLEEMEKSGIKVVRMEDYFEETLQRIPIFLVGSDQRYIWNSSFAEQPVYHNLKLLLNKVFGIVFLILTLPLMVVAALAVLAEDGRPVFYAQTRVGKQGRIFTIHKFRTMIKDAEQNGAMWTEKKDPRVTRVGRFLRRYRIDELPQLINVLRGEMNLVGPRPERPEFAAELARRIPFYHRRHVVKPGITGWAQVRFRYGASIEDTYTKLAYDLWYVKNRGLMLDLQILIETAFVVLGRRGSR